MSDSLGFLSSFVGSLSYNIKKIEATVVIVWCNINTVELNRTPHYQKKCDDLHKRFSPWFAEMFTVANTPNTQSNVFVYFQKVLEHQNNHE